MLLNYFLQAFIATSEATIAHKKDELGVSLFHF